MLIAEYGLWSDFAPGRDPESYVEDAHGVNPATCDLYAIAAEFRRAVNAALPDGVTLAGTMFLGPYEDAECQWDSPLDIAAIISSIDLEPIIKAHQAAGRGEPAR